MHLHEVKKEKPGMPMKMGPMKPRTNFDFNILPEGKKWEIGQIYLITLEVKQVGKRINEAEKDEHGYAEFEILKAGGELKKGIKRHT